MVARVDSKSILPSEGLGVGSIPTRVTMIIYKPLKLKFKNRLEAKRYFGQTKFNELMKNKDNFEFLN